MGTESNVWTYERALRTELVHMLGTYCEAPQTRGRSCRSIVKEPPPLGGRAQQLISNSVSSSLGFYTSLDVSVILPFSPGSQERPDSEDMRGWEGGWLTPSLVFIVSVRGSRLPKEIGEGIFSQGICFHGTQFPRNVPSLPFRVTPYRPPGFFLLRVLFGLFSFLSLKPIWFQKD